MSKKLLVGVIIIVVVVLFGAGIYLSSRRIPGTPAVSAPTATSSLAAGATSSDQSVDNLPVVKVMGEGMYERDYSIDKNLMGISHNVFVAKITKQTGAIVRDGLMPETHFGADVIFNIKGNLTGTVALHQVGGYLNGVLYVPYEDYLSRADTNGGGHLLQPGFTYLLATRYNPAENSYTLGTVLSAVKLISDSNSLNNAQLQDLAKNDSRVKQLQAAYPIEVLFSSDVYSHTTWNSYQSLTEVQKYALPYYTGSYNPNPPMPSSTITTSTVSSTSN